MLMALGTAEPESFAVVPHEEHAMPRIHWPRAEIAFLNSHYSTINYQQTGKGRAIQSRVAVRATVLQFDNKSNRWQRIENYNISKIMERSLQNRYLNSQDQLIISLNDQIEAMTPLKQSYSSLQRYHIKLAHDFESLLVENDHVSEAYSIKIQELLHINEELDAKKNQYIEELRNLENQKAKMTLDRKNMMACCETLSSKFNLESEQNILLQQRTREIIDSIKKTQQSIALHRKIIAEIETQIRLKSDQNAQIEGEVMRRIDFNRKSTQRSENTQTQIKAYTARNEKTVGQIKSIDKNQDNLQQRIREELKRIKETNEKIITRREELAHLNHQKQYYLRLIESQLVIKEDLNISETKLNGLLERRSKECDRLSRQILEMQQAIQNEEEKCSKSTKYKDALSCHLGELIRANGILLQTMRKCCKEDEKVHHVLHKKLDGLDCALIRSAGSGSESVFRKTSALRERTNQMLGSKQAQKSGSTWIKQLDIENM